MYVEMDKNLEVNLMGMSWEEAVALKVMIEGASLEERRIFNGVLRQLNQPFDLLYVPHREAGAAAHRQEQAESD